MMRKSNRFVLRIAALVLAICMAMAPATPVRAALDPPTANRAFELPVYSTETETVFTGRFLGYGYTIYVAEETVRQMTAIGIVARQGGGISVSRDDTNASVIFEPEQMVTVGDTVYWPYKETMTMLCINTAYRAEEGLLRVMPVKGIWKLRSELGIITEEDQYRMGSFRDPSGDWLSELLDYKTARGIAMAADIGKHWLDLPKYVTQYAQYEMYRDAIWKIMLPELDTAVEKLSNGMKIADGFDWLGQVPEAFTDTLNTVATNQGWEALQYTQGFYDSVMKVAGPFGKTLGFVSEIKDMVQAEDQMKYITMLGSMETMNSRLLNGLSLIEPSAKEASSAFVEALTQTLDIFSGEESPYRLMYQEIAQGTAEYVIDEALGWTIFDVGTTAANFIADSALGTQKQIDATLTATTNLLIQDAAQDAFRKYFWQFDKQSSYTVKAGTVENMVDCTLVYLLAGYNAWRAMEFDEDMKAIAADNAEQMIKVIDTLMSYSEFDFLSAKCAEDTESELINLTINSYVEISVSWNSEVRGTPVELAVLVTGTDSSGTEIALFSDDAYYPAVYDSAHGYHTQVSPLTAVTRTEFSNSVYLSFIDMGGNYNIRIQLPEELANEGITLRDCEVSLYANWQEQNAARYTQTDQNGNLYYDIPVPAEWLVLE